MLREKREVVELQERLNACSTKFEVAFVLIQNGHDPATVAKAAAEILAERRAAEAADDA